MLVAGATFPLLLLVAFALHLQSDQQNEARAQLLRDRTTAASRALGARLELAGGYLRVVTASTAFERGDDRAVYDNVKHFLSVQRLIEEVILLDPSGGVVFRATSDASARPPVAGGGACRPLAPGNAAPPARRVSVVKSAGVGEGALKVRIGVPVRSGAGWCELVSLVPMRAFGNSLREEQWPAGWVAAIVDGSSTILARSRLQDEFVGTMATTHLRDAMRKGGPTLFEGVSREGTPVMAFTTPVPGAGSWHVTAGVATAALDSQIRVSTGRLLAGSAAAVLVALACALAVGNAVAADVQAIAGATDNPRLRAPRVQEIGDVAARLASDHQRLLESAASQTGAIASLESENRSRIAAEHVLKTTQLRLLDAHEGERRHLARELHDELGQDLALLRMTMRSMESRLKPVGEQAAMLADAIATVERLVAHVRSIAVDLRPAQLDDLGLSAALKSMVRRAGEHSRVKIELCLPRDAPRLPGQYETALFRIAQAALTNAVRHSGADAVRIELQLLNDEAVIRVADHGAGFDVKASSGGLGVRIMRERAEALGGTVLVESTPGRGTTIVARVPLQESVDADVH